MKEYENVNPRNISPNITYLELSGDVINCEDMDHLELSMLHLSCNILHNTHVLANFSILQDVYIETSNPLTDYSFITGIYDVVIQHTNSGVFATGGVIKLVGWKYTPPNINTIGSVLELERSHSRIVEDVYPTALYIKNMICAVHWKSIHMICIDVFAYSFDDVNLTGMMGYAFKTDAEMRPIIEFKKKNRLVIGPFFFT